MELNNHGHIHEGATFGPNCKKITIGRGSVIHDRCYIDVPELTIGEYTTIHNTTCIHGYKPAKIGHNCWIGQNCVLDSIGGLTIGNNVGIGGYSQLWSHMKFGDTLAGCRWKSEKPLLVEDNVWFVGHCIVSPIHAAAGSMALVGSVVTKDMEANHVYGGSPAKDLTDKIGTQFQEVSYEDKKEKFEQLYREFLDKEQLSESEFKINVLRTEEEFEGDSEYPTFFLEKQFYKPTYSEQEMKFMKSMLYDRAKFLPV